MDLAPLVVILAFALPLAGIVSHGVQRVLRLRIEEARARAGGLDVSAAEELSELRAEVGQMRADLYELQERVDFAERALAQSRERMRLPPTDES